MEAHPQQFEEQPQWTAQDSEALYMIDRWGAGYFDVNPNGAVTVSPLQENGVLDAFVGMLTSTAAGEQTRALGVMAKLVKLRRIDLLTEVARGHPDRMVRQRLATLLGLPAPSA